MQISCVLQRKNSIWRHGSNWFSLDLLVQSTKSRIRCSHCSQQWRRIQLRIASVMASSANRAMAAMPSRYLSSMSWFFCSSAYCPGNWPGPGQQWRWRLQQNTSFIPSCSLLLFPDEYIKGHEWRSFHPEINRQGKGCSVSSATVIQVCSTLYGRRLVHPSIREYIYKITPFSVADWS